MYQACVDAVVAIAGNDLHLITCDAILTPMGLAYPQGLQQIYEQVGAIIAGYRPREAAIEDLFFGKNETMATAVAQAHGVALRALAQSGLIITEYVPSEVKLAATGYVTAREEQVEVIVCHFPRDAQ
jgi:crossover junction endodeoxyribonuclease RuvC